MNASEYYLRQAWFGKFEPILDKTLLLFLPYIDSHLSSFSDVFFVKGAVITIGLYKVIPGNL
jgi:hypothetical protein